MKKIIVIMMLAIAMLLCGCETHTNSKVTHYRSDCMEIEEYVDDVLVNTYTMNYQEYALNNMKD